MIHDRPAVFVFLVLLFAAVALWLSCCTTGVYGVDKKDLLIINTWRTTHGQDTVPHQ